MADPDGAVERSTDWLVNSSVDTFSWSGVTVTVKDRKTKAPLNLVSDICGHVQKGELVALMGPSGCGKTTLLNALARRTVAPGARVAGTCVVNGKEVDKAAFRRMTSYVEQEDALIGSVTVEETLKFAADLSLPSSISSRERADRVGLSMASFGLLQQSKTLVGTPIRKGLSGGQKRRLSIASQLITCPRILFLDEPTSGLDSKASFEVMSYIKKVAEKNKIIVIASIHQPSTRTFEVFDKLLLLSGGKTCFFGPTANLYGYIEGATGSRIPEYVNPAEYLLDIVSSDFAVADEDAVSRVQGIQDTWAQSPDAKALTSEIITTEERGEKATAENLDSAGRPNMAQITLTLLHRSLIKSFRDVVAYGIRIVMYLGLAIMMGTVWLRLSTTQESIQPFTNAIFFGSAFMSFMAVAYVPAFLEDRQTFSKERANGLYGATPFIVSNFLIGLPFLFLISVLFSIISYWLSNFDPSADAFFTWVMWLFLDLVAAESLVVLVSSIFPNFVIALALVAFANGLWMSVGGFLVSPTILNPFWRYVFHYIDYQAYVFQGMMVNEFSRRNYSCGHGCHCMYVTDLASQCQIRGTGVLESYGYATGRTGKWVGILIGIIAVYRLFGWIALSLRKT
ncbi:hypothetical protein N7468_008559 [Penicillium chermesinum]|uniref:ABC transporter domain-containing protein n=1 Tax=Penicillium chermesinum TaxID=63820 RepID=A0A9W9NQ14_9EURO|nr:uncharacterized protein N7468_008559 [Penicillium chermesinum]KAJ5224017.1 hypothetical protein N7468_008559 [Penicillium chermesinum]